MANELVSPCPEGSACGVVDEDIYPEVLICEYNTALGTQIPPTVENACAIRIAIGRGAARNFNKNWGTAIYSYGMGALQPKIDLNAFKIAYEAGATYFWHWFGWPGMSGAVVPYSYKRAYAAGVRQFFAENPKRDMKALLNAADVCITLPYGFTFSPGPLHSINWLHLERKTKYGVSYRQILLNAGLEVERCIRNGIKFDIAINEPRFKPNGYKEIIHCLEDGTVKIVRKGKKDEVLPSGRIPKRPDLGPMPKVELKIVEIPSSIPGTVKLKSTASPGTGELHSGLQSEPAFIWEVYTPVNGYIYLFGEDVAFEAKYAGDYKIRVAVMDCFGRPAFAETVITLNKE